MDARAFRDLMAFYESAGVDETIGDAAVDRYAEARAEHAARTAAIEAARDAAAASSSAQSAAPPDGAPGQGLEDARRLAAQADSLEALAEALAGFEGCTLRKTARSLVFSDGNPQANVMLIGEAPGRDEDARGLPFVGRSGQLLDAMLAAIGLDRQGVYIGNVIYWRPPGNRTPTPEERALCEPFIRRQIALVRPKLIMTLGGSAMATLLGRDGIMRARGQWMTYRDDGLQVPALPTLHPAALLRNPINKRLVWRDFLALRVALDAMKQTDAP